MKKIFVWSFILILLIATLLWYFFFKSESPTYYLTETVQRGNITRTVSATGDIVPTLLIDVGVQATGQIKKFYVRLGQEVKKGDLIAEIDSEPQQNTLSKAKAELKSLEAQLINKKVSYKIAKKHYSRQKKLYAANAASQKEYEAAEEQFSAAQSAMIAVESSIEQAKIDVSSAETNLGYTRIEAPTDGTIVSTAIEVGQTVNSVQSSPTLVQIADLSNLLIRMQIAEGDITKIKKGMDVNFITLADPEITRYTTIDSIDPGLTLMSQNRYTRTTDPTADAIYYYARALIDNSDRHLRIGMTTENTIEVEQAKNVLFIPTVTIKNESHNKKGKQGKYVTILLANGKTEKRVITTGLSDTMNTEILSGLKEGEQVISSQSNALSSENSTILQHD